MVQMFSHTCFKHYYFKLEEKMNSSFVDSNWTGGLSD